MVGIYKFTNKLNQKVYIGKSINIENRYKEHLSKINHIQCRFYSAIKHYGIDGFSFEVIHECSIDQLNYWERFYIRYYNSNDPQYGYNMTDGGDGSLGLTKESRNSIADKNKEHFKDKNYRLYHSNKTKEGMKKIPRECLQSQLGKPRTKEEKYKISKSMTGIKRSDDFKDKLRARKGEKRSKESCNKMHNSAVGKIWITNGITDIKIYPSDLDKYEGYYRGRTVYKKRA